MPSPLLIGSCEPFSGKSAVVLGLAQQLRRKGHGFSFGKPLATCLEPQEIHQPGDPLLDADVRFIGATLGLEEAQLIPSLAVLEPASAHQRLLSGVVGPIEGMEGLQARLHDGEAGLVILEGAGRLSEGWMFGLGLVPLARALQAVVVLVHPWHDSRDVEPLLEVQSQLGPLLAGVVINGVPPGALASLRQDLVPALESIGLPVLGVLPRSPLLRSVTVEELSRRLGARVLCSRERLDLLVETLSIGAMNVNSAMEFFRRRRNMAVVTGADRTDIQLAALEASTQCLILTGVGEPLPQLLNRAEELEVPVLKVDHDTLTTVEVVEGAIGQVRLHEAVKATYAMRLVEENCHFERLFERLKLT
ncbi:MAG: phosphotransacetylase family protein [Cyanobacteriota bacterium]|nr:phosphotransacetylase family protein [Cyanobacteriota bacterium]